MRILYFDSNDFKRLSEGKFVIPSVKPDDDTVPYVNLDWFLSEVNRMAEDRMLITGVLEGAHHAALKSLSKKIKEGTLDT